jgi:hypothetical protein
MFVPEASPERRSNHGIDGDDHGRRGLHRLGANPPYRPLDGLAQLRRDLRGRLAASSVCDAIGFTRQLEAAYRTMWRDYCRRT